MDRKLFTVHSALVAHHSKALGVLANGSMSEAKEGCAMLEDVDQHTFVRFSQYAYTGNYVAAEPDILLDSSSISIGTAHSAPDEAHLDRVEGEGEEVLSRVPSPPPNVEAPIVEFSASAPNVTPRKDKKKKRAAQEWEKEEVVEFAAENSLSKKTLLWYDFKSKKYATPKPAFRPRKNRESCEDYTEVFLCHARLYVFADKYDIGPLKDLSLHKLQQTLAVFTLYGERVGDIVELMRYSYEHTADLLEPIDELRLLVIHYAGCVVEDLARSVEFRSLLEEAGSLAGDLFDQMLKRLN